MSWLVRWTNRALRVAARLDRATRERINREVETFTATGQGDVKRLKGTKHELFRLRVGGWRIFFSKEEDRLLVVRAIRPRGTPTDLGWRAKDL